MKNVFLVLITMLPGFAQAGDYSDSQQACAVAMPEDSDSQAPETGISLDSIASLELSSNKNFAASVAPTLQLDWDNDEQITNLTPAPAKSGKRLIFGDYRNGFQAVDYKMVEYGLGAEAEFVFGNTTKVANPFWASVGLLPIKGKEMMGVRYFRNRESLEARSDIPHLQHALSSFDRLVPSDALSYSTKGGIIFWVGAGISVVDAKLVGLAQGEFDVYIEKIDGDHAYVQITESKLKSFGLQAEAAYVTEYSTTRFKKYGDSLGFLLNVHDRTGIRAFKDLVRGNIAPVQKLAASGIEAVKFWDESRVSRIGTATRFSLGIPFLFKRTWSKNSYFDVVRSRFYSCARSINAVYSAYFKRKDSKTFSKREHFTKAFYGASYALKSDSDKAIARGFFGQSLLSFRAQNGSARSLRKAMDKLAAATGLGDVVLLRLPSHSDKMDYASFSLRTQFSAKNTQNLVNRASGVERRKMNRIMDRLMNEYFAGEDKDQICSGTDFSNENGISFGPRECRSALSSKTERAVDSMVEALKNLGYALKKGSEKHATKAYAKFGEAMMTNQFTFRLGLMLAGDGLKMDYVAEGSDLSQYVQTMRSVGDTGKMVFEARDRIYKSAQGQGPNRESDRYLVMPQ